MAGISELSRTLKDIAPEKIDQSAIVGRSVRAFHERKTGTMNDAARAAEITQRALDTILSDEANPHALFLLRGYIAEILISGIADFAKAQEEENARRGRVSPIKIS